MKAEFIFILLALDLDLMGVGVKRASHNKINGIKVALVRGEHNILDFVCQQGASPIGKVKIVRYADF